jgi:hypothetical protein
MRKSPMFPELRTCVPPQSSFEYSPTDSVRTRSPYFSPNRAMNPSLRASSIVRSTAATGIAFITSRFTAASSRRI